MVCLWMTRRRRPAHPIVWSQPPYPNCLWKCALSSGLPLSPIFQPSQACGQLPTDNLCLGARARLPVLSMASQPESWMPVDSQAVEPVTPVGSSGGGVPGRAKEKVERLLSRLMDQGFSAGTERHIHLAHRRDPGPALTDGTRTIPRPSGSASSTRRPVLPRGGDARDGEEMAGQDKDRERGRQGHLDGTTRRRIPVPVSCGLDGN